VKRLAAAIGIATLQFMNKKPAQLALCGFLF
jgi:hypothetical protein